MAFLQIPNIEIKGISACVPKTIIENIKYSGFTDEEKVNITQATGIYQHRIADEATCSSDLCFYAAKKLINDLQWDKGLIDCLIFVSQTPDFILPATSCILQDRLGLGKEVIAFDITMGCSGWIYGLQVISSLMSHGFLRRGLLLVGDTTLKFCSSLDKSTFPIFGDAGTVTALEYDNTSQGFKFHSGTDGSGCNSLIIPDGGFRNLVSESSFKMVEIKPGITRNRLNVILDGMNILAFSIKRAPESILNLSDRFKIDLQQVNYFLFHQANLFINERIRNKLNLPIEKVPYSFRNYGNTGPGSIPLTMVSEISESLKNNENNIIACGFGVGLSWGSVQFFTKNIICPEIVEI
jgi:3-oxoacyl-[acyl-carrier-protein] synthase-3